MKKYMCSSVSIKSLLEVLPINQPLVFGKILFAEPEFFPVLLFQNCETNRFFIFPPLSDNFSSMLQAQKIVHIQAHILSLVVETFVEAIVNLFSWTTKYEFHSSPAVISAFRCGGATKFSGDIFLRLLEPLVCLQ